MKHEKIALEAAVAEVEGGRHLFLAGLESGLEKFLFASRWLMAPIYVLMVGSLAMLLVKFTQETWHIATHALAMTESDAVLAVLSLIDITLTGNLMMMVLFAGYENFVSKMEDLHSHRDRPEWMGHIGFSDLKLKLIGSIVAISGIELLKAFMNAHNLTDRQLGWMVGIHVTFLFSGLLYAAMDRLSGKGH